MYTATMRYKFKQEQFDKACEIWQNRVMEQAKKQEGFVRMQFLTSKVQGVALAIGTWENQLAAQNFMKTGVFKELLEELEGISEETPQPEIWNLLYFVEGKQS